MYVIAGENNIGAPKMQMILASSNCPFSLFDYSLYFCISFTSFLD